MNNAWKANCRQNLAGETRFRHLICPHLPGSPIEGTRFAVPFSRHAH